MIYRFYKQDTLLYIFFELEWVKLLINYMLYLKKHILSAQSGFGGHM